MIEAQQAANQPSSIGQADTPPAAPSPWSNVLKLGALLGVLYGISRVWKPT